MSSATSSLWHRPLSLARARWLHGWHSEVAPQGVPSREPLACVVVGGGDVDALGPAVAALDAPLSGSAVVLVRLRQPTPVAATVHAIVDLLRDKGCGPVASARSSTPTTVTGGTTRCRSSPDRRPRRAHRVRHALDVVDLGGDLVVGPVPDTSVLSGRLVSRAWVESSARVVVGRAVTDLTDGYAACLAMLLGAAPAGWRRARGRRCRPPDPPSPGTRGGRRARGERRPDGGRLPQPVDSRTLVVATDLLAADGAAAALLGLDRRSRCSNAPCSPSARRRGARRGASCPSRARTLPTRSRVPRPGRWPRSLDWPGSSARRPEDPTRAPQVPTPCSRRCGPS